MKAELHRKSTHLSGLIFPIIYFFLDQSIMLVIVGSFTCIAISVELAKWFFPPFRQLFFHYLKPLLRPHEQKGAITGATYYIVSTLLCVLIFDKPIAIVCIIFIALGDTAAALVGSKWGRTKLIGNKSLEGSAACFIICTAITLFWRNPNPIVGLTGAFVATLVELLPLRINDNLTMPLISGTVMQIMINYLPL